ncbi:MAG: putative inorganic carbon transporter subunit DabA [Bacteroidota bacterium]
MSLENVDATLHRIAHYLPSQAPLKDFIHHNTLHAFQGKSFHQALNDVNKIFGYQTYLQLEGYRNLFKEGKIKEEYLYRGLNADERFKWKQRLFFESFDENVNPEIGRLRSIWKSKYKVDCHFV